MALRAYYEQKNRHGFTDRIEIDDSQFGGTAIELTGDKTGFSFQHDAITSESSDGIINVHANKIQVGKLNFRPYIDPNVSAEVSLLEDIRDSANKRFTLAWKRDGSVEWKGYITTRIFQYPEKSTSYFAHIRATDFELLKGSDFALEDNRQTFIDTFATIFGDLGLSLPIKTATSWIEENLEGSITGAYDFLDEVYHETKALRDFANTGDETDQPITNFEALERLCAPALLIRQIGGHIEINQISAFASPTTVNETIYDSSGTVTTATQSVDRTQTGYTTVDNGTPVVKVSSSNDTYPGLKRVKVKFDHRTEVSSITLPSDIELVDSGTETFSQLFIGDGTQEIELSFDCYAETDINESTMDARFRIKIDTYWLQDDGSWDTTTNNYYEVSLTKGKPLVGGGNVWRGSFSIITDQIPNAADGTLDLVFAGATGGTDFADDTLYTNLSFNIKNPVATEASKFINYQLTQADDYPTSLALPETWYGDGPTGYSVSALRYGTADGSLTADSWQRSGSTAYRNFHENVLKEVMDFQRNNTRKLEANLWGSYDPSSILDYDSNFFYYAAGKYSATKGEWNVTLLRVNENTASDTFDDIPKFSEEGTTGSGTTSGGGGGGLDQSTADNRYLNESAALSDGFDASDGNILVGDGSVFVEESGNTARISLGLEIGTDVQAHSSVLDGISSGDVSNWDAAYSHSQVTTGNPHDISAGDLSGGISASDISDVQPVSSTEKSQWDTAYAQRGSQIAGVGLTWDGSELDFDSSYSPIFAGLTVNGDTLIDNKITGSPSFDNYSAQLLSSSSSSGDKLSLSFHFQPNFSARIWMENDEQLFNFSRGIHTEGNITVGGTVGSATIRGNRGSYDFDGLDIQTKDEAGNFVARIAFTTGMASGDSSESRMSFLRNDVYRFQDGEVRIEDDVLTAQGGIDSQDDITSGNFFWDYSEDTLDVPTIQVDTLRTTLFKPNSVSGMGGEFVFNGTTQVVSIDTGANTIVVENAVFGSGDAVIVSGAAYDTDGFTNVELNITSAGSAVSGGTEYSYTVNSGSETDIASGDTVVKVDGNLIYVNANEGATNAPFLEGYSSVSGFADSPLSGGTATPNWYIRNNEISIGSVFSADGSADTGTLAGADVDTNRLWNYDSNGGVELHWTNQTLKFFEDNGTTDRLELNIDNSFSDPSTLTTVTTSTLGASDSGFPVAAGSSGTLEPGIAIGKDGAVVEAVIEISGDSNISSDNVSGEVRLEFYTGSTWETVDTGYYDGLGVTQFSIRLAGLYTGYTDVRATVVNDGSSDDSMAFDDATWKEIVGKTEVNLLGMQVAVTEQIYSKFGGGTAEIGGNLTVTDDLIVEGDAFKTGGGSWNSLSDGAVKNELGTVDEGTDYIESLGRGKWFNYKKEIAPNRNVKFAGFDARDAGVARQDRTYKGGKYATFNWNTHQVALHNAILELKDEIRKLKKSKK